MPHKESAIALAAAGAGLLLWAPAPFTLPGAARADVSRAVAVAAGPSLDAIPAESQSAVSITVPLIGTALAAGAVATALGRRQRPAARVATRAFEKELGVQAPAGFWDPLDFCKDGDAAAFKRRRAVEIKHGRISMYACIGYIAPEYFRWPGELSPSAGIKFTDVPNGLGAFSKVPFLGWFQILGFCGALEITGWTLSKPANIGLGRDASVNGEPGNYGLGVLGAFNSIKKDPAQRARKLNAELANGRLAMISILGMLFQNGTIGTTGPDMWWFESLPEYAGTVGDFMPRNL